jgi:pimeloyl-ACP methyl ester carboxylesterase
VKLATRRIGTGQRTAALVHGASMSSDIWREFANILVEDYDMSVILVDLRGHGDSPRAERYLFEDFIGDLVETLPTGLDFLIGQSLGGISTIQAAPALAPKHYIGIDPALDISKFNGFMLRTVGPLQPYFPDWLLRALGSPPKGAAPGTLMRYRASWKKWDSRLMRQLRDNPPYYPFVVRPPDVPSTIVLADPSFAVSPTMAAGLRAAGWDVRIKPGGVHELHVQDPAGLAALLDDVLKARTIAK